MRTHTNVPALHTQRILSQTNSAGARSLGRLSSGFRINRAADDAAGLGIANQLRPDLRGPRQAARNAEQANSVLQIAEGATQTVSGILDRMKELAVQAASDNVSDEGRAKIQAEFAKLQDEITRIVDTTKFHGKNLLNGTFGNVLDDDPTSSTLIGVAGVTAESIVLNGAAAGTYTLTATANSVTLTDGSGNSQTIGGVTVDGSQGEQTWNFNQFGIKVTTTDLAAANTGAIVVTGGTVSFMVSVSGEEGSGGGAGQDDVSIKALDLTLTTLGIDSDSLATKADAQAAIANIDGAISKVSDVFGEIGAAQNRLEFAMQNVNTTIENVAAAESTIRDADMAAEMAEFTRNQILQQAGTAMLAQANMAPQLVLQLLR